MYKMLCSALVTALLVIGCTKQEPENTATKSTASQQPAAAESKSARDTAVANATHVTIHILGTSALVPQNDATHPLAVVLREVGPMPDGTHAHVPYVAWRQSAEQGPVTFPVETKNDTLGLTGAWRVHRLAREELVITNDLSSNPAMIPIGPNKNCAPGLGKIVDVACVPNVAELSGSNGVYNDAFVRAVKPAPEIVGRMQIGNGKLAGFMGDGCKWVAVDQSTGQAVSTPQNVATEVAYHFDIPGNLQLQLRSLNDDLSIPAKDLVTLAPNEIGEIDVRFGNAVDIFPGEDQVIPKDHKDPHFAVYYDFLTDTKKRPDLKRTSDCGPYPVNRTIYCGPGNTTTSK